MTNEPLLDHAIVRRYSNLEQCGLDRLIHPHHHRIHSDHDAILRQLEGELFWYGDPIELVVTPIVHSNTFGELQRIPNRHRNEPPALAFEAPNIPPIGSAHRAEVFSTPHLALRFEGSPLDPTTDERHQLRLPKGKVEILAKERGTRSSPNRPPLPGNDDRHPPLVRDEKMEGYSTLRRKRFNPDTIRLLEYDRLTERTSALPPSSARLKEPAKTRHLSTLGYYTLLKHSLLSGCDRHLIGKPRSITPLRRTATQHRTKKSTTRKEGKTAMDEGEEHRNDPLLLR